MKLTYEKVKEWKGEYVSEYHGKLLQAHLFTF